MNLNIKKCFSARFDKQDEDDQVLDETEFDNISKIIQSLTQSEIDFTDTRSQIDRRIQNQKIKASGYKFDKVISNCIFP